MSIGKILNDLADKKGVSKYVISKEIGVTESTLGRIFKDETKKPSSKTLKLLANYFGVTLDYLRTGKGEMLLSEPKESKDELKPKEYAAHTPVKLVTTKARAGYSDAYYADEYLEDMPTVLIETDKEYHGKYLAFEVNGDSMEPDYHTGDIVICKEIKRELWRYKLQIDDWDFVIVHGTQGIMLKQITVHNVETGEIVCHSINQDGHPDFTLNLREVAFLFNVVEHRMPGKNKRRYR